MCGIAGILGGNGAIGSFEERISRMQDRLLHRGPDDKGLFIAASRKAALAHTRLSIIDLSAAGRQPMRSPCGRFTIVFNGEIYNYRELRAELLEAGVAFHTETDTEVILQLYHRLGNKCVDRLRGMFAFAIWDEEDQSCFLARDPLGIKPLYYNVTGHTFAFASEIRALLAAGIEPPQTDALALYGYLRTGSVPEPLTPIRNLRQLEAGSFAQWRDGRLSTTAYWSPEPHFRDGSCESVEEAVQRTRQALIDSIEHHLVSDVPVGIFLSGGIDSTALLALARVATGNHISTFSIRVDDPALNEGAVAMRTAKHFQSDHSEFLLDARRAGEWITDYLRSMDLPSLDGFNTYCVSRFASQNGAKVVLSGLGGDEIFGGYGSFDTIPRMLAASRRLGPARRPAAFALGAFASAFRLNKAQRLAGFLSRPPLASGAFLAMRGIFTHEEAMRLLGAAGASLDPGAALQDLEGSSAAVDRGLFLADQVSLLEMTRYMRNQLLRDSDVMSMASGLELRVPFVDRTLFETLAAIPARFRIQPGKKLLTSAVPEIPSWILDKPKRGFALPFSHWLETSLCDLTAGLPDNSLVPHHSWYRKWTLIAFRQWQQTLGLDQSW